MYEQAFWILTHYTHFLHLCQHFLCKKYSIFITFLTHISPKSKKMFIYYNNRWTKSPSKIRQKTSPESRKKSLGNCVQNGFASLWSCGHQISLGQPLVADCFATQHPRSRCFGPHNLLQSTQPWKRLLCGEGAARPPARFCKVLHLSKTIYRAW